MSESIGEDRLAEKYFRLIVEASPNAVLIADETGKMLLVNTQAEIMFGYDRDEMIGQPVEMLIPMRFRGEHPEHVARYMQCPSARAMGGGRDLRAVRKDGTEFPVEVGLNPVETEEGLMVLSSIIDITQRKIAEDALRSSEASLRSALQKLKAQTGQLEEANESLSQYAYVVSHDIKAPLRAIRNYSDFLQEDLAETLKEEQSEYLHGLAESVDQCEHLVNDLLLLSRIERRENDLEAIELGKFLSDLVASLQLPGDVEVSLAAEWPSLRADAVLLRQIFQNLLLNAVKFNQSAVKRVELGCASDSAAHVIHVRDNGIGIEPRHQEQIFRVFQRLHGNDKYEGTGIGLAIVKKAVTKLGGTIRVESEAEKGSTFFLTFPATLSGTQP